MGIIASSILCKSARSDTLYIMYREIEVSGADYSGKSQRFWRGIEVEKWAKSVYMARTLVHASRCCGYVAGCGRCWPVVDSAA